MEQESDHSNSDQSGAGAVANDERVRTLVAEKDQLVSDLTQAKSAIEASEREVSGARRRIQELTAERDQLVSQVAQARSAIESAEREVAATRSQIQEFTKEKARLVADKERAQVEVGDARDQLRALDAESVFEFIKRRYFSRK